MQRGRAGHLRELGGRVDFCDEGQGRSVLRQHGAVLKCMCMCILRSHSSPQEDAKAWKDAFCSPIPGVAAVIFEQFGRWQKNYIIYINDDRDSEIHRISREQLGVSIIMGHEELLREASNKPHVAVDGTFAIVSKTTQQNMWSAFSN